MDIPGTGIAKDVLGGARDVARGAVAVGEGVVEVAADAANFAVGAGMGVANIISTHHRPPSGSGGDLFEPRGDARDSGADFVDAIGRFVGLVRDRERYEATRAAQPLLATVTARGEHGATVQLAFDAEAPGNDWGARGRESTLVSVYVDGEYHSDVAVLQEHPGHYRVNLGELAAGEHTVELRSAQERAPEHATPARVREVRIAHRRGDDALVDRYQPIFEGRDLGGPGGASELAFTDTPLLVVPTVVDHRDGTRTIEYRVLFSNEDHGTSTLNLFRDWGRTADYEAAYRVTVDEAGNRIRDEYEGPAHEYFSFDGERDGERPVLRIATGNNNFSQRLRDAGSRYSGAPVAPMPRGATSVEVMLAHPWTWEVMSRELQREHGHDVGGLPRKLDARHYLYVAGRGDGIRDHLESRRPLRLQLHDGRTIDLVTSDHGTFPEQPHAVLLPTGVRGHDVARVLDVEGNAYVLGDDHRPRQVAAGPVR